LRRHIGGRDARSSVEEQAADDGVVTPVFVTTIRTLPLMAHCRYTPPLKEERFSVSSTAPLVALITWICSFRPALSQSTA